jgi:hypothetical protein
MFHGNIIWQPLQQERRLSPAACCPINEIPDKQWKKAINNIQQWYNLQDSRLLTIGNLLSPDFYIDTKWYDTLVFKRSVQDFNKKLEAPASCPQSKQPSKLQTFGLSLPNLRDFRNIESNFGILQSQRNTSKYCIAMQGFGKRSSTPENWLLFYRWTRNDENEKETISWRAPCEKHQPESTMQTIFKQ